MFFSIRERVLRRIAIRGGTCASDVSPRMGAARRERRQPLGFPRGYRKPDVIAPLHCVPEALHRRLDGGLVACGGRHSQGSYELRCLGGSRRLVDQIRSRSALVRRNAKTTSSWESSACFGASSRGAAFLGLLALGVFFEVCFFFAMVGSPSCGGSLVPILCFRFR